METEKWPPCCLIAINGKLVDWQRRADDRRGRFAVRVGWRDLARSVMRRRAVVIEVIAGEGGCGAVFTEKHFDPGLAGDPVTFPAETLGLPSGTVLTGTGNDGLVIRFTAHARVLIGNGLCPLHETLLQVPADPRDRGGLCSSCARCWFLGPVTPYVVAGQKVTGGEPLRPG